MRSFTLANGSSIVVHEARSVSARMRGLLGRPALPQGEGLLLKGKQVHTFGMRFAIDAVYIGLGGAVLRVVTLPPRRFGPLVWSAKTILEMAEGEAARLGVSRGMTLS